MRPSRANDEEESYYPFLDGDSLETEQHMKQGRKKQQPKKATRKSRIGRLGATDSVAMPDGEAVRAGFSLVGVLLEILGFGKEDDGRY